jgi:hypothetical protein
MFTQKKPITEIEAIAIKTDKELAPFNFLAIIDNHV